MSKRGMFKKQGAFRWMVERFDREAGMVRIEVAPLKKNVEFEKLLKALKAGEREELSWWDADKERTEFLNKDDFQKIIETADLELAENMVFWVEVKDKSLKKIFNATPASRELSRWMYNRMIRPEAEDAPGPPAKPGRR